MSLSFEPISEEERQERKRLFPRPTTLMVDMVVSKPANVYLPQGYKKIAHQVKNLKLRPDDVLLMTFPKAGTTWTQEMLWQIVNGFDSEKAKESILLRSPFLEMTCLSGGNSGIAPLAIPREQMTEEGKKMALLLENSPAYVDQLASPRIIKTHLPLELLPERTLQECKVVWVARNAKDSLVSYYHHSMQMPNQAFEGSFDEYAQLYMAGKGMDGSYWHHLKQGWKLRSHPRVKFLWFEDMKKDIRSSIREVAGFLEQDITEEDLNKLAEHLSFANFKKNVNMEPPMGTVHESAQKIFNFARKGQVGGWKDYFKNETLDQVDKWISDNNDIGIPMRFDS